MRYLLALLLCGTVWAQAPNGPYVVQACQNVGAGTVSSVTCVFGQNVVSGNTIFVGYDYFGGSSPSLADTRSTTYTNAQTFTAADGIHPVIASGTLGSSGANTVTLSITSATFSGMWAVEVANTTATKDVCATAKDFSGTPASVTSNSLTAAKNGEFLLAFISGLQNGGIFNTVTAPFTMFSQYGGNDSRAAAYQISGTNGSYSATFANATNVSGSVLLCAFGPAALSIITPSAAPDSVLSSPYDFFLSANGGTGAYTWSIQSGTLQPGLALNSATGEISGTPNNGGNHSIVFKVTDGAAVTATKTITLKVATAPFNTAVFVQGKAFAASAATFNSNVTAGNMIVVGCQNGPFSTAGASWQPPNDSLATPFYIVDTYWAKFGVGTGNALWLWYGIAPSGGANTVHCNGIGAPSITLAELSNVQNFIDAHAITFGSGATGNTTITSGSLTPLEANSLLYSGGLVALGTGTTIQSPFASTDTPATLQVDMGYRIITSLTGYTVTYATPSASDGHWMIELAAFRPGSNGSIAPETSGGVKSQLF